LFLTTPLNPEQQELSRITHDSASSLLVLLIDILDFSKLEAGKLAVERAPFRLAELVESASTLVVGRTQAKGLALRVDLAPGLPEWVEGDALRIKQVLVNLLGNAIKFTERGSVQLSVAQEGERVAFHVTDTGIGISQEQLSHLFRPFEQADGSTTRRFGGTGLGLAISHNLAQLMGGEIVVQSQPGEGSVFTLRLPLAAVAAPDVVLPADAAPGRRLAGLRVLAAEDNEVNRMVLQGQLELEGAQVVFATNGQEAVDAVAQSGPAAFHAVLMDVQMPVMDGLEATRRIRALTPLLPVIGLTAHALVEERERCLAAGMVEHVAKPVELDALVAALRRHTAAVAAA
jgi:CheY-like chemotaxis protein